MRNSGYFDSKRDKAIIEAGGFWCSACLVGKPATFASPDPRYCQGCYEFLSKEAEMSTDTGRRAASWKPVTPRRGAVSSGSRAMPVSEGVVSKIEQGEDIPSGILKQRGRPRKQGEVSRVTEWRRNKAGQGVLM